MEQVQFKCIKQKSRLRVRIITPGYNNYANCQFPRNIRKEGCIYSAPSSAIKFARGPAGTFFYRVSKKDIKVISDIDIGTSEKVKIDKIYEEESPDCVICMDNPHNVVIVPCGHYCLCNDCALILEKTSKKCPMCRGHIELVVTQDMISM